MADNDNQGFDSAADQDVGDDPRSPRSDWLIHYKIQPTNRHSERSLYNTNLAARAPGTAEWLTSSQLYQEWLDSPEHGLLWITGMPGSGKTVHVARLVDEVSRSYPESVVLFFFFSQSRQKNHDQRRLFRDWFCQLLKISNALRLQCHTLIRRYPSFEAIPMTELWEKLEITFGRLSQRIFCVVDGIDEMDPGDDTFLTYLEAIGRWDPRRIKLLITSRSNRIGSAPFGQFPHLAMRLEEGLVDHDISRYAQQTIRDLEASENERQIVADALAERAGGSFTYAKLALEAWLTSGAEPRSVLSYFTEDQSEFIPNLLQKLAAGSELLQGVQELVLQFVIYAPRPPRLAELVDILKFRDPHCSSRTFPEIRELIRSSCGPLIMWPIDGTICTSHHSLTEYMRGLSKEEDGSLARTHARMAMICLRYLQSGCLDSVPTECRVNQEEFDGLVAPIRLRFPFLDYASKNWFHHIHWSDQLGHDQSQILAALDHLFGDPQRRKACFLLADLIKTRFDLPVSLDMAKFTRLRIAACTGLVSYTKHLLLNNTREGLPHDDGPSPLWFAAYQGHVSVVRLLLSAGAVMSGPFTIRGQRVCISPLVSLPENRRLEIAEAFFEAGVSPFTRSLDIETWWSCFVGAYRNGRCHARNMLSLPVINNIEIVHELLAWAARFGNKDAAAVSLRYPGVDVNAQVQGCTPLFLACGSPQAVEIVILLLRAGADASNACAGPVVSGKFFEYHKMTDPERVAQFIEPRLRILDRLTSGPWCTSDWWSPFRPLFEAGLVDIQKPTRFGHTALHGAASVPDLVELLLDAGLDANSTDCEGSSALHYALDERSIELLIEKGDANINLINDLGQSPLLSLVSISSSAQAVLRLLAYAPDCSILDRLGNSVLHCHLFGREPILETIEALLKAGADPNVRDRNGLTPLLRLRRYINGDLPWFGPPLEDFVQALLDAGASTDDASIVNVASGADNHAADNFSSNGAPQPLEKPPFRPSMPGIIGRTEDEDKSQTLQEPARCEESSQAEMSTRDRENVTADDLFQAIFACDKEKVGYLLSGGMDANIRRERSDPVSLEGLGHIEYVESHEMYPLFAAAWQKQDDSAPHQTSERPLVETLLHHGADPFLEFGIACPEQSISSDADEDCFTKDWSTEDWSKKRAVLHELLLYRKPVEAILQVPNLEVNRRDAQGRSLLHALFGSRKERRDGARPRWKPKSVVAQEAAQEAAREAERFVTFKKLVSLGADLKARDNLNRSILHYILESDCPFDSDGPLIFTLREAPELMDQADAAGNTPLHYAARNAKRFAVAKHFLSRGANHLAVDNDGDNILHMVLGRPSSQNLWAQAEPEFWVDQGVDINARNKKGETPMFAFCKVPKHDKDERALRKLKKLGADLFVLNNQGDGLLHAVVWSFPGLFGALREMGLDMNLENGAHQTSIDVAVAHQRKEVLVLLDEDHLSTGDLLSGRVKI